jgi:hypothetical protein
MVLGLWCSAKEIMSSIIRAIGLSLCVIPLLPALCSANTPSKMITPESRAQIIRTLGSEFIALKVPLPISKNGLTVNSKGEFDWKKNEEESMRAGQFIAPGITVQITTLTITSDKIIFEVNGGGRKKRHFLEHIQLGAGGGTRPVANPTAQAPPKGSYVTIKFEHGVPDLTPDQVKEILSPVLEFSKKSATKTFVESVPDEFKEAAKNKQVVVGMDKDLVLAIMGRPLRKVRDKKGEVETEDWIYGERPQKVIFVTFMKGRVVGVKEY